MILAAVAIVVMIVLLVSQDSIENLVVQNRTIANPRRVALRQNVNSTS